MARRVDSVYIYILLFSLYSSGPSEYILLSSVYGGFTAVEQHEGQPKLFCCKKEKKITMA